MDDKALDTLGAAIDSLDNLIGAAKIPMGDSFHMEQLRHSLPEISANLKLAYAGISGENPWG